MTSPYTPGTIFNSRLFVQTIAQLASCRTGTSDVKGNHKTADHCTQRWMGRYVAALFGAGWGTGARPHGRAHLSGKR